MKPRCVAAVQKAAGRELTQKEVGNLETMLEKHLRLGQRKDPEAWRKLSETQRMDYAAKQSIDELVQEANLQKYRIERQIEVHDKLKRETGQFEGGRLAALQRKLISWSDGKGSFRSIETLAGAIRADALRHLTDAFEALDPRLLGLFENKEGVVAFTRALYGQTEGIDPKIVKASQEWLKVAGDLREQFNGAGGKIGKLQDWVLPQHHSQRRVAKAGADQWVSDVLPKLDRARYVKDNGALMNDTEIRAFLQEAWRSIATNGWNDVTPGEGGQMMLANRRAAHREIHFKDADGYMEYQAAYGDQGLLQIMVGHVDGIAKEIATIEEFGPNAQHTYAYFRDLGMQEATTADPQHYGRYEKQAAKLDNLWMNTQGLERPVASERLARAFEATRNFLVSTRLGGAVISSIADEGTILATARVNQMPYMQVFRNELAAMNLTNKEELRQARRAGLALDTAMGDLNRFGQDNLSTAVPAKLAALTMRASGLTALTDVRRRAFGVTMMDSIGHLTRNVESLYRLDADDHQILLSKGITDQDWQVWRAAEPEQWGDVNHAVLTPDAIYKVPDEKLAHLIPDLADAGLPEARAAAIQKIRRDAALKLLGAVAEEVDMAVITPKAREREFMTGGEQRGTWKGELTRSVFLFKSTPIAVVWRHMSRGMARNTTQGRSAYIATFVAAQTVLGAFAMQTKEILAGRDPRNLNPSEQFGVKNWVQAFLQGGAMGIYGDFLFSGATRHESSVLAAALGPVAGLAEDVFKLTQGNLVKAAQGKETHVGADLIRFAKGNTPLANLWYTKAALDHLVVNQLQEMVSPGYLATQQRRMQREFGASYFWAPQDALPGRAPDLGRTFGQ